MAIAMDELRERCTSNEKVICRILKSLVVGKDDDSKEKLELSKAPALKLKHKRHSEKKIKTKSSPGIVADGTLIFSKFDLVQATASKQNKEKQIKKEHKLKKNLKKLKKQEGQISKLVEAGETKKAVEIKNENAWKNALERAEGKKVLDDPKRLERSLKKHKKTKQKHAKEWADRKKAVENKMRKKQEKREKNIKRKIENKRKHKSKPRKSAS